MLRLNDKKNYSYQQNTLINKRDIDENPIVWIIIYKYSIKTKICIAITRLKQILYKIYTCVKIMYYYMKIFYVKFYIHNEIF